MTTVKPKITLQCVREGSRLRIRFFSYTDDEGKIYKNAYDESLNCQFPKDIRVEGYFYEIDENDLSLVQSKTKSFYNVRKTNIRVVPQIDITSMKIFEITECVICMAEETSVVICPCGHKCICAGCSGYLQKTSNKCPICRSKIMTTFVSSAATA